MKMTPQLRKAINAAVRGKVKGPSPFVELGLRYPPDHIGDDETNNALVWDPKESDLEGFMELRKTKVIDDSATPGRALLDLYVTTGHGPYRELETNVAAYVVDGELISTMETTEKRPDNMPKWGDALA